MSLSLSVYTLVHVMLSVLGIVSGLVVIGAFMSGVFLGPLIVFFLLATALTSITGFGFPFTTILPSHVFGVLSMIALLVACVALYARRLADAWRPVFAGAVTFALYLNTFVLLAQLLQKTPSLASLAPGPNTPVFAATQAVVLIIFVALGRAAVRGFKHTPALKATSSDT